MNCYAKDLKPGFKIYGHERGWLEVLSIDRDRTVARLATSCPCVCDMRLTLLNNVSGEIYIEGCNTHTLFEVVE